MAKRRAVDSDSEEVDDGGSSTAKRARVDQDAPEVKAEPRTQRTQPNKTKGKRRQDPADDGIMDIDLGDDENDVVEFGDQHADDDEEAQARFEQENEEIIREAIRAKSKLQGGVAKFGIIEAIEMHQFMCHKYLTFKMGPQINFIIGHNGSGKSAVLSAITVALGGKATSTGRGSGLKSFIREGQAASEVSIQLKNQGDEAYKHDIYGDSIIITRRFTKEGSSSYKIKSRDGKVISTKREELSAICDHMNIQVDNPMNVLTQDAARQFLSASHPSDKYKFFLRGTQLSQLSEEYETCLENISQTTKVLMRKKEAIPDLQERYKEASARFEEASKAREQRNKVDELKKELAWAHVSTKEEELREKVAEQAKVAKHLGKVQQALNTAQEKFDAMTEEVTAYEEEFSAIGNTEHLIARKKELTEKSNKIKDRLQRLKSDEIESKDNIKIAETAIGRIKKQIEDEKVKAAAHSEAKQQELHDKLEKAQNDVKEAERQFKQVEDAGRQKREEAASARTGADQAEHELHDIQNRISECDSEKSRCLQKQQNALSVYGQNMDQLLDRINRTQWRGQKPVGPLGKYIKAKSTDTPVVLRHVLGSHMNSFACTNYDDRNLLKRMLVESQNSGISVLVAAVDLFDYSRGEPPENCLTVLRAIEVSDPWVLRLLINQAKIESTMIAQTRADADAMALSVQGGGVCFAEKDQYRVVRYPDGGGMSSPLQLIPRGDPRNMYFTNEDTSSQLRNLEERLAQLTAQYHDVNQRVSNLKQTWNQAQGAAAASEKETRSLYRKVSELKHYRDTLQTEANDNILMETAGLTEALADHEGERSMLMGQLEGFAEVRVKLGEENRPYVEELSKIRTQLSEFAAKVAAARTKVEDAVELRMKAQNEKKYYAEKLAKEQDKLTDIDGVVATLTTEFEDWTAKAEQYCERFENPRSAVEVQRQLDSVRKALEAREKRHGATVEEMTIEVNRAQEALQTAQRDLKNMIALNRALKQSLRIRLEKWYDFRRHIAFRCKVVFQYHLSNRGYFGKVVFNHQDGTLQLKVQTDDLNNTQGGSRDKDPRSLSGGEKSFATICLLLAMWESIGSPIRCLDEFDVFMDAVNRRISMKMMIDTANSSDGKQYILITPQNMQSIHVGTTVRVHRMSDPERGQGTLANGVTVV
ncbi:hypothetical protein EVG20_g177 [Dentipellis fragilis]|uniref:RecF/RecN/SMC N-terminal domain-containing protein n=1 Tax=Dentipellis fragilis TaxID=205917 RepID=A0A4Y9ZDC6_9AGAM|nr:hypothetical protein EVG20_g177 [Dentipellis fragilis]